MTDARGIDAQHPQFAPLPLGLSAGHGHFGSLFGD